MALKEGDRVRQKNRMGGRDLLEGVIVEFEDWFGDTMMTVKLDEPISCGCGASHASKMICSPKNWERIPVQ